MSRMAATPENSPPRNALRCLFVLTLGSVCTLVNVDAPLSASERQDYVHYDVGDRDATVIGQALEQLASSQGETVKVVIDHKRHQLLLQASPRFQDLAAGVIRAAGKPAPGGRQPRQSAPVQRPQTDGSTAGDVHQAAAPAPSRNPNNQQEQRLETYSIVQGQFERVANWFELLQNQNSNIRLAIDERRARCYVWAPEAMHNAVRRKLNEGRLLQSHAGKESELTSQEPTVNPLVTPVAHVRVAQAESPQPSAPPTPEQTQERVRSAQASRLTRDKLELLQQLGLDVDVEILPNLDVVVLRGRDADVERVAKIIERIEALSQEAEPEVRVVMLQHIASEAAGNLIEQVLEPLTDGRQGRVEVEPLGTPNAILLIGWGQALEAIEGLIKKIDQPVAAHAEVTVLRLQNAIAQEAEQLLDEFFANREGLGPQVVAIAEPRTNSLIVHASPRDLKQVRLLLSEIDVAESQAVSQMRVFRLRHALAEDLVNTLQAAIDAAQSDQAGNRNEVLELIDIAAQMGPIRSGLLNHVEITANSQTNSLVAKGPADSLDLIAALIEQLDQPVAVAQIKVFRITNGDATSLVLMLRSLMGSDESGPRTALAGGETETSLAPLRFSVEQRTNSIIATGSAGDLRIIEALLLRLDNNDAQRRRSQVYRLKNAPATNVALAVNEFLRSERILQQVTPGSASPLEQVEREVVVVPEALSNSLIISATPRFFDEILGLIERLDAQPPQVMIQVLIAEVALGDFDEFGVEMGLQDSVLFDRSLLGDLITTTSTTSASTPSGVVTSTNQVIQAATNTPGFNFNSGGPLGNSGSTKALTGANTLGSQGITNFAVGRVNDSLGFGGLVLSASSESISLLVRALQQDRRLEVLSRPQVMTMDNQPAFIQVGQKVPRIVATQLTNFGQVNSIELDNVGLIVGVTPRVSPDGMVVMEIDAEKSQVGPESEGIPVAISTDGIEVRSPRIDVTTAQTTVSAASGETIVLGGLITRRQERMARRVPLLADIPLLGDLFRYDFNDWQRSELLIILTPRIILNSADAELLRQQEAARMSWCAADVHALHGEGGFCTQGSCAICDQEIPVIYPDRDPRGESPLLMNPEPSAESPALPPAQDPNFFPERTPGVFESLPAQESYDDSSMTPFPTPPTE